MNKRKFSNKWTFCLAHICVIAWMVLIFCMSAQPGDTSGEISGGVSHFFMQIWDGVFGLGWDEGKVLQMAELWDYPIRKLAHMTEFGILAILIYWALGAYERINASVQDKIGNTKKWTDRNKRYAAAWLLTVCYAATDELHQRFVPDRSGNVFDVFVDGTGALLALLCLYGLLRGGAFLLKRRKKKK